MKPSGPSTEPYMWYRTERSTGRKAQVDLALSLVCGTVQRGLPVEKQSVYQLFCLPARANVCFGRLCLL